MKIAFSLVLLLISSQAIAGDLYFVCSQYLDPEKVDEEFVVNRSIESDLIQDTFIASVEPKRIYEVTYDPSSRLFTATIRQRASNQLIRKISTPLKPNRPLELSSNIYCAIID